MTGTLLLVEDDEVLRGRLARALAERGLEVITAGDVASARQIAARATPELAVVDLKLPDGSGLEVLRALLEEDPATKVVVLTGYGSIATAIEAVRLGAVHYLPKPADADEVLAAFTPGEAPSALETPSLARAEWEHIQRVLADCEGNVSEAARRLGLHRRSLQRKLGKYPPGR